MNIRLHTPKSMKNGSGIASWKQFMLSLLATTISIALTFGTAAGVDYKKKQKEKYEIVMMVIYDMYNSLVALEKADSMICQSIQLQRQIAEDTTLFDTMKFQLGMLLPKPQFTETTEKIFSSNIETINTVGNVFFTEYVAEFYQDRQYYKTIICDSIYKNVSSNYSFTTLKGCLNFDYSMYALLSSSLLDTMWKLYERCKQIMDISDKKIEVYQMKRKQMEAGMTEKTVTRRLTMHEIVQLQEKIENAKKKITQE